MPRAVENCLFKNQFLRCYCRDGMPDHRTSNDHASDHASGTAHCELSSVRSTKVEEWASPATRWKIYTQDQGQAGLEDTSI